MIRRLLPHDVEDYRRIRLAALRDAPSAFGSVHALEADRPLEEHAARLSLCIVFGAYASGGIVGMIGLKQAEGPKDAHKGMVWGYFVAANDRRQGIGDALLRTVIEAAHGVVEQVMLSVVAGSEAIRLYERHRFVTYGVEPRALKTACGYDDEVLMARLL